MRPLRATVVIPGLGGVALLVGGRTVTGCVALGITVVQLQAPVIAPATSARVERILGRWGHAAAHALAFIIWLPFGIVVALGGIAARLLRIDPLQRRQHQGWVAPLAAGRGGAPTAAWAVHHRAPVSGPVRALRWGLVLVLVVAVAAFAADRGPWGPSGDEAARNAGANGAPDPIEPPYAVRGDADVVRARQEEGQVFAEMEGDPVTGWRLPATFDGDEVSVADHHRTSVQAADHGPVVWFFGGSTMFGSNQRDGHTIASDFARIASADGQPVQVVNFGVHAFTAFQEAQQLEAAVEAHGAPDLVIFYDGYNDTSVALGASFLGEIDGTPPRAPSLAAGATTTTLLGPAPVPRWSSPEERYQEVAAIQRRAAAFAERTLEGTGTPVLHFWQPNAFTRTPTKEERAQLRSLGVDDRALRTFQAVHAGVRANLPDGFVDLGDVLDDAPTVFADQVHTNELGAELVARAMYDAASPTLGRLR